MIGAAAITNTSPITGLGSLSLPDQPSYAYVNMPAYDPSITPATFEFSIKKSTSDGMSMALLIRSTDETRYFYPFGQNGGTIYCGDSQQNPIAVAYTFVAGTVYHCATTFDGTTWRVYVNGVKIGQTGTQMRNQASGFTRLTLGQYVGLGAGCVGQLDNVRITFGIARYTGDTYTVNTL
jgi:hypothetical protein